MQSYKNFSIGQTYRTRTALMDENNELVPKGAEICLVGIAAKVRMIPKELRDPELHDSLSYFYNAVRAGSVGPRIRANFCTLEPAARSPVKAWSEGPRQEN